MATHPKDHDNNSAFSVLTELAVEGTSSLVEAQRAFLDLAQQENNVFLKGLKEQVAAFPPAMAMTDFVRRSVDALIEMQQELLTSTSKQTVQWLEPDSGAKPDRAAQVLDFARESVESFARAQKKFLDAVAEESEKAIRGKPEREIEPARLDNLKQLACDAGNAFLEAQKRLLDISGQQMSVSLNAANRTTQLLSPEQLMPVAMLARDSVKSFFDAETALVSSMMKMRQAKEVQPKKKKVSRAAKRRPTVAV